METTNSQLSAFSLSFASNMLSVKDFAFATVAENTS